MFARAAALRIGEEQKSQLEELLRTGSTAQRTARGCQVVLLASQGLVEQLDRPANRFVAANGIGGAGCIRQTGYCWNLRTAKAEAVAPGTDAGTGAADSGHNPENQTRGRDALERARAGFKAGHFPHDGAASLATP